MKISEATLGNLGDVVASGTKNVKNAVKAGDTTFGPAGGALGAFLDPNRIASGITTKDQMAQNNFVEEFVSKAMQALQTGIKGKYIDPNLGMSSDPLTPSAAADPTTTQQPQQPQQAAPQQQAAPKQAAPQAQTTQEPLTFGREKYTKGPKGWVDSKGKPADPNVSKILDQASAKAGAAPEPSKPVTKPAAPAQAAAPAAAPAQAAAPNPKIIVPDTYRKKETPGPAATQPAATKPAKPQAGRSTVPQGGGKVPGYQSMSPGAQRKRAVRAAAKTPAAPAAAAPKRQSFSAKIAPQLQNQVLRRQAAKGNQPVRESNYQKLNAIFESYYKLLEAEETDQGVLSIPDYIGKQFLPDFLKGIPYSKASQQFLVLLKAMEKNPKPTKELTTMAKLAWSLVPKTAEKTPVKKAAAPQSGLSANQQQSGPERQGTDWGDLGKNL